jgi:tritrans,polycis-undecaprenyl-diphosphate synthase [geranylgeranyl-diphosphate specific]
MPTTLVIPHHIGFILDGNRRFAKLKGLKPWRGHTAGAQKVHEILDWCYEVGVKELTLYSFSMQNFYRPAYEVKKLMEIIERELTQLIDDERIDSRDVRVSVIGQKELLPHHIQKIITNIEEKTRSHTHFQLNICLAYGGKEEIVQAVKKIIKKVTAKVIDINELSPELVSTQLDLQSEPDLIIRTGGEHRTSNFLTWQSVYSEWFFVSKLLPEFTRDDFSHILSEYANRERRYGR